MEKEQEDDIPEWACSACGGYGIQGHYDGSGFVDYACEVCGGSGVKPGVTPPWGSNDDAEDPF
jgi:DnaJ-class molecular chaperone